MGKKQLVVIVDDDRKAAETLRLFVEREGYDTLCAYDGEAALTLIRDRAPAVVLLDVMLPGIDGFSICREVRKSSDAAILMLTAKTFESDRVHGLRLGADDYIVKPYSAREVVARIAAVLRRTRPKQVRRRFPVGRLTIDADAQRATLGEAELKLTPTQFRLLAVLAENAGTAIGRAELIDRVLGGDFVGLDRTIDMHVAALRKRLSASGATGVAIATKFGFGYRLEELP